MNDERWILNDGQEPLQPGQAVKIMNGPFADFEDVIGKVNQEEGKVRVHISFFRRDTPVELDFLHVERLI